MHEYNILTKKTPIVCATKRNSSIAEMPFMPEIYHKEFNVVEFIGESLAGIRDIKTVHYFHLVLQKLVISRQEKLNLMVKQLELALTILVRLIKLI